MIISNKGEANLSKRRHEMKLTLFLLAVLALTLSVTASPNVFNFEIPNDLENRKSQTFFSDIVNNLITKYHLPKEGNKKSSLLDYLMNGYNQKVNGFKWTDCGGTAGKITALSITPDPITLPGTITISAQFTLTQTIAAPLTLNVTDYKGSLKLPCIEQIGSCVYTKICDTLANVNCPPELVAAGINCQCPFEKKTYKLPPISFEVDIPFPQGSYNITAVLWGGQPMKKLVCLSIADDIA